jgi:hypothetical protein
MNPLDIDALLAALTERAARRSYLRSYPDCIWGNASERGRATAYSEMKAADVIVAIREVLVFAEALNSGLSEVSGG